ncbi:hypothetical protein HOY80DRAFT_886831, partial [Tuber brumale]
RAKERVEASGEMGIYESANARARRNEYEMGMVGISVVAFYGKALLGCHAER